MKHLAPLGPVYQAGTLSGNPIAVAAGIATLKIVSQPNFFRSLELLTNELIVGLRDIAEIARLKIFHLIAWAVCLEYILDPRFQKPLMMF